MSTAKKGGMTDTDLLCGMIGDRESFEAFIRQSDETEHIEADNPTKDDVWALKTIQSVLSITSGTQMQQFDRTQRDEALALLKTKVLSIRQLERLTGINRGIIQKAKSVNENRPPVTRVPSDMRRPKHKAKGLCFGGSFT